MKSLYKCRLCGGLKLSAVLKLRNLPVSHALRTSASAPDPRFDLGISICAKCGFLQVPDPVPAEVLYTDTDTYTTGFHKPRHLDDLITTAIAQQDPGSAIDIGCNDGALMDALKRHGHTPIIGVEPIMVAASVARKKGYPVYSDFMTLALANKIKKEHGQLDAVYLRHVAEHVYDLDELFGSVRAILRDGGLLVMELPQVEPGLTHGNPSILWEEHVNYFSEPLARYVLEKFGFAVLDKRHYAFGGGAIAFVARKQRMIPKRLTPPKAELSLRLAREFKKKFARYCTELAKSVRKARNNGYRVAVYGAAPRSCVVAVASNVAGMVDLVIDDRADIQGRLMPGTERSIESVTSVDPDGAPMLCLLGVGSENEFKVRTKLTAHLRQPPIYISLLSPRDTLASIAVASKQLQKRRAFRGTCMKMIDLPLQPNGTKVQWSYLPKQFSKESVEQILDRIREFVPTGDFTLGKPLREFEERFAKMIGVKHAIGVNSGTDALRLSLKGLGVGPGDEVITAANTFIATIGAIGECYARPVLVDCTDDFCMEISQIESNITSKTKALMPVHLAGQMTNMPELLKIAARHNLPVVEDSCQCILGAIDGKYAGTYGNSGAFSLHPLKNLNVWSDGGMIVTNDDDFNVKLRRLRNHGLADRDNVVMLGSNSRLDSLQAVVGNWLIDQVDFITSTRIKNAAFLDEGLGKLPGIRLPTRYSNRRLVFHLYIVFAERRDELVKYCKANGIEVKVHYPIPVYRQEGLRQFNYKEGDFPVTDRHAETMISFPAHEHLTRDQLAYIVQTVSNFYTG